MYRSHNLWFCAILKSINLQYNSFLSKMAMQTFHSNFHLQLFPLITPYRNLFLHDLYSFFLLVRIANEIDSITNQCLFKLLEQLFKTFISFTNINIDLSKPYTN